MEANFIIFILGFTVGYLNYMLYKVYKRPTWTGAVLGRAGYALIKLNKASPIRNEAFEIYKWEYEPLWINPYTLTHVSYLKELGRTGISLANGKDIMVEETPARVAELYREAMS